MIGSGPVMMRGTGPDHTVTRQQIRSGTAKRILPYTRPYRGAIAALLAITALSGVITVVTPLLFKYVIDDGVMRHNTALVLWISLLTAGLALATGGLGFLNSWLSARVSEGLVYELRTTVYDHVQRQPIAFFTRAQTGSLVSRLNTDVVGAQQAVTSLLSTVFSSAVTLVLVLGTMLYLSWQITLISVVVLPLFILPGKVIGRRLQRLTREQMQTNAEAGALMNERFNVSGALLAKLYGRPEGEQQLFGAMAEKVRKIGVTTTVYGQMLFLFMGVLTSLATALVYGLGGALVIHGSFQIGTLVALATLLVRLFMPINQLSNAQASILTMLVSFDRVFEVIDLKPLINEKPGAVELPTTDLDITFDHVSFRYPAAKEVSLASLEAIARPMAERTTDTWTLEDLSFTAPAGKMTALVGMSGAGKTTITHLVPRLYDPNEGAVRIGATDIRDVTLASLRDTIGMVTQDSHLFHQTLGDNLRYARPEATDEDLVEACKAAQIWDLIQSLPDGFDTVVGDRGYRLSGGEKQRIAIARLLLKAPPIVVLDEATAHLDSESEVAIQEALRTALTGRTSLVIAHRLSTIRDADQILVIDKGQVRERGTHEELLAGGGLYAELYRTQFSGQSARTNGQAEVSGGPFGPGPGGPHGPEPQGPHGPQGNGAMTRPIMRKGSS